MSEFLASIPTPPPLLVLAILWLACVACIEAMHYATTRAGRAAWKLAVYVALWGLGLHALSIIWSMRP